MKSNLTKLGSNSRCRQIGTITSLNIQKMEWEKLLSSKRIKELESGKPKSESIGTEFRTEFQRDYDRCLFSTPVRRLQDKAQVFPLEPNDSVRTRLTHSLEVSQIARGIASKVTKKLIEEGKINYDQGEAIILIAVTSALIHDLGNPPFGHSGEDAMRLWFKNKIEGHGISQFLKKELEEIKLLTEEEKNDLLNFEGNAQTIRLISKLQMLGDFSGLNLTAGTLSASRKYTAHSMQIGIKGQRFKKLGYFQSEKELIELVERETGTENRRNPITFLVEAADDIAYSIIDLEDGIKKGVVTWELISRELKKVGESGAKLISEAEKNINERCLSVGFDPIEENGEMIEFKELKGKALDEARISILRTFYITEMVDSVSSAFLENYESIMEGGFDKELVEVCDKKEIIKKCKGMAVEFIFPHNSILKLELMGKRVIHDLMDILWEGIVLAPYIEKEYKKEHKLNQKTYDLLSSNYRSVFESKTKASKNDGSIERKAFYLRSQLLADYICGMTDSFAVALHKELKNG